MCGLRERHRDAGVACSARGSGEGDGDLGEREMREDDKEMGRKKSTGRWKRVRKGRERKERWVEGKGKDRTGKRGKREEDEGEGNSGRNGKERWRMARKGYE